MLLQSNPDKVQTVFQMISYENQESIRVKTGLRLLGVPPYVLLIIFFQLFKQ